MNYEESPYMRGETDIPSREDLINYTREELGLSESEYMMYLGMYGL